ncbi:MAG: DUF3826 domain-containing protein [Bacteroidetes bacterium]|nr:MAG: DUF3826 domain-containing protein [Bacteroidota bacterium]
MNVTRNIFTANRRQERVAVKEFKSPFSFFTTTRFKTLAVYIIISLLITLLLNAAAFGQNTPGNDEAFKKVLTERSHKIVNTLEIADSGKFDKVVRLVADQYYRLNKIHDESKASVAAIKGLQLPDEEKTARVKKEDETKAEMLGKLHKKYISQLKKNLTDAQIEKVKNGMTYNVLNVTYTAYTEMLLNLTEEQKKKIYNWLVEARELAMDEGSSDDKHKVFGKYKGRINNYLSTEGYDMKKEEKAWQDRLKEKKSIEKQTA